MPAGRDVTPQKWKELRVLFDESGYSVVAGQYEGRPALGERWNGDGDELGFPNASGNPIWHVVPEFLRIPVLSGVLHELARNPTPANREKAHLILAEWERFA